jgi:hypothetical protein
MRTRTEQTLIDALLEIYRLSEESEDKVSEIARVALLDAGEPL